MYFKERENENMANMNGTTGDDILAGTLENDSLEGFSGDDTLLGHWGDDTLQGGPGRDTLDGGRGHDWAHYWDKTVPVSINLDGLEGSYVYVDGVAEDVILNVESVIGGTGNDVFIGDGRDNIFNGWSGQDALSGQGGADHFVYSDAFDSSSERGTILDFNSGEGDKVNLGDIGGGGLAFNGTHSGARSVWYEIAQNGGDAIVKADTDHNIATVEFSINLVGVTSLTADDFILV